MPEQQWCKLERFDYSPLAGRWAVVRMLAALEAELRPPVGARLLVHRGPVLSAHGAFVSAADRRSTGPASELLWIASFAVPLEIVEYRGALFELSAPGRAAVSLPALGTLVLGVGHEPALPDRRWLPAHARRRVSALATAVAVSTASIPATGLAATRPSHSVVQTPRDGVEGSAALPRHSARPGRITLTAPRVVKLESHARVPVHDAVLGAQHRRRPPKPSRAWSAGRDGMPTATDPSATTPAPPVASAPTHPAQPVGVPEQPASHLWSTGGTRADKPADKHVVARRSPATEPDRHHVTRSRRPTGGAPVSAPLSTPSQLRPVPASVGPAPEERSEPAGTEAGGLFAGTSGGTSALSGAPPASLLSRLFADVNGPPPFLVSIYKRAAHRYQVPWSVLAAINSVESDYGRNLSVSSAGAVGWMQFMPGTWREYGVDANRDGKANPYDPTDAIFAAARYLRANGAPQDLSRAIFAYNHATWYVDEVIARARWISANSTLKVTGLTGRRIAAMTAMAELLVGRPYVWGGGHGGWQIVPGYDCSGFVSAVLHAGGYLASPQTTDTLPSQPEIKTGPGRYVTIFDRTAAGAQGHVIIDLNGTFFESGGSATTGGGAGVKKLGQPPFDYLLSFNTLLHPSGL